MYMDKNFVKHLIKDLLFYSAKLLSTIHPLKFLCSKDYSSLAMIYYRHLGTLARLDERFLFHM